MILPTGTRVAALHCNPRKYSVAQADPGQDRFGWKSLSIGKQASSSRSPRRTTGPRGSAPRSLVLVIALLLVAGVLLVVSMAPPPAAAAIGSFVLSFDQDSKGKKVFLPLIAQRFRPVQAAHLGYGANIASADHVTILTEMGFDWAKGYVSWENAGTGPGYDWVAVDNQMREFVPHVRHILLRLGGPPPSGIGSPPASAADRAAFQKFAQALATHIADTWRGQGLETVAYEIWNEPNLDYEWGGRPNVAQYTALLRAGYQGIKAGDPRAIVVSAGLAPTGGSLANIAWARAFYAAPQVIPDLTFLRGMYEHGAKGYFDALGSHPYGGPDAPGTAPNAAKGPIYFRRAEEQRQVMLDYGDTSPMWVTEFGWVLDTDCGLGEHEWMEVSESQQAAYLAGAYAYADANWPWMGPMFLFNLDFGTTYWYAWCDPVRWYSITHRANPKDPGNSPILYSQAFYSLRDLAKRSAW